jgi:hypothetical protein
MPKFARITLATLIAALLPLAPAAADVAKGKVALERAKWRVADAIAYPDDDEIEVVFSDTAFDRKEMASDGKIDTFDVLGHGNTLTLNIAADGPTMCIDISSREGDTQYSGSTCNSDFQPAITLSAHTAERVAGRMQYASEGGESIDLEFDLPIAGGASGGKVERPGKPLPADGGAPGKAVLAHFAAAAGGDWNKLKSISHPDQRSQMEASEKAGEHQAMFEFLQKFTPRKVRITGGTIDGEHAQVDYTGEEQGRPVTGIAEAVQFEGKWYFAGNTTKD